MYENGILGKEMVTRLMEYVKARSLPIANLETAHSTIGQALTVDDWLWDFYADLRWRRYGRIEDLDVILKSKKLPEIQEFFMSVYKFDFKEELREARKLAVEDDRWPQERTQIYRPG